MNKVFGSIAIIVVVVIIGYYAFHDNIYQQNNVDSFSHTSMPNNKNIAIVPIEHASAVINWDGFIIYIDPVGGAKLYDGLPAPDAILITDIHGDHLSIDTLKAVVVKETIIVAPRAVTVQLPADGDGIPLASRMVELNNDDSAQIHDFVVQATPMYNIPESSDAYHVKGRGNGYIISSPDGFRLYISGDTGDTPEMRALQNIDLAFVSMNLPYTMTVEAAASAVIDFKPKQVYPYHYRGTEGFSDVAKFKELVNDGDPTIEVVQLDWYPT